ncbi:MAG: SH3 domain-containing protein, partial [Chloroflexota bacterium]
MAPQLFGKAIWAWPETDMPEAIELAQHVGARYIFYHVLTPPDAAYDGASAPRVAKQIRDAGLLPVAWYSIYLNNAQAPRNEALYARRAVQEDGYLGVIFDAEARSLAGPEGPARALQLARHLTDDFGLDPQTLFFCSFPNILSHLNKRFDELVPTCRGGLMPMCYGTFQQPPRRVITDWAYGHLNSVKPETRWGYRPAVYPVLGAYTNEAGTQPHTPQQFTAYLNQLTLNKATFASVYRATKFDRTLWDLFRDYEPARPGEIYRFPGEAVASEPVPQRWVAVRPFLNVRSEPRVPAPGESSNRIGSLLFGAQVSLLPDASRPDTAGRVWVRIQFGELAGWVAQSANNEQYLSDHRPDGDPGPGDADPPQPLKTGYVQPGTGLALRQTPTTAADDSDWPAGAVVTTGTWLTAIGPARVQDDRAYQRVRLNSGAEGWVLAERAGERYLNDGRQGDERAALVTELTCGLRLYSRPEAAAEAWLAPTVLWTGLPVKVLQQVEAPDAAGRRWTRVLCPDGQRGWVVDGFADGPHRLMDAQPDTVTPTLDVDLLERPADGMPQRPARTTSSLNIRTRPELKPDTQFVVVPPNTALTAVGEPNPPDAGGIRWQRLRWSDGSDKWVSARFLAAVAPAVVSRVAAGVPLFVLRRVGADNSWLHVRSLAHKEGYIRANETQAVAASPERPPAEQVPRAESPFIFGIHDAHESNNGLSMYVLPNGTRRTGWAVFTEEVGNRPEPGRRHDEYARWADRGFGVIARLNHGYGSTGTIPDPNDAAKTDGFIQACATWAQNSGDGCHIWFVGNEVNNPREWPRNTVITPAAYASVFNRVRAAIRQGAHANDRVCPSPIDPYNAQWGDARRYFVEMLRGIHDLDGLILRAYTHTPELSDLTHTRTFGNAPLLGQYFDFQVFKPMLDLIPALWRNA